MRKFVVSVCLLLIALGIAAPVVADTRLGDSCDLAILGLNDKNEFLRFDHEFRTALTRRDAAATALLTQFPLRVNFPDGSHITLNDPATLQKQFERAFPPALRESVRRQSIDDVRCHYTNGIGYVYGDVWVNFAGADDKQLRIVMVNVPGSRSSDAKAGDIDLACSTRQFRIAIDATGKQDAWRYRVWNLPRSMHDKPDLELAGTRDFEGTSPCTHRIWRFQNGNTFYELSEPGCGPDAPPKDGAAQLMVYVDGQTKLESWCF